MHFMFLHEHTETWIYKINTKDPKLEELVLERVFREPVNYYGQQGDEKVGINNCYLVRVGGPGGPSNWDGACIIQHFNRKSPKSEPFNEEGVKFDMVVQGGVWKVRAVKDRNGWEAWRKLTNDFNPKSRGTGQEYMHLKQQKEQNPR